MKCCDCKKRETKHTCKFCNKKFCRVCFFDHDPCPKKVLSKMDCVECRKWTRRKNTCKVCGDRVCGNCFYMNHNPCKKTK